MTKQKFQAAIEAIDRLNSQDPNTTPFEGRLEPEAVVYSHRMSQTLNEMYPDASMALRLAVRAQHIERWKVPRNDYPQDRAGYHRWRNDLKKRHAKTAAQILQTAGFDENFINTVSELIAKKNLKTDPEAQALEDVACLVFFKHYAVNFAKKHQPDKVSRIVEKTLLKMSPLALKQTKQLNLPQPLKSQLIKLADVALSKSSPPA